MLIVFVYLCVLAVAALLTFAAFGDVTRTAPPAEGSSGYFAFDASAEGGGAGEEGGKSRKRERTKKLFAADSVFVRKAQLTAQQQRMLSFLEDHCVAVPVRASSTTVLTHPSRFYEELKRHITEAEESIFFSALYIGDGPLSKAFVDTIQAKVEAVVAQHERRLAQQGRQITAAVKPFEIGMLLDYNRMHDSRNLVTVRKLLATSHAIEYRYNHEDSGGNSSNSGSYSQTEPSLMPSDADCGVNRSPVKVRLYLYQGPCRWNRLFAPFSRAKEVLGVQHTKLFVFDKRHLILTGANLSDDYFATRMDRYVLYENNEHAAHFFLELLTVLFAVSHPVVSFADFVDHLGGTPGDLALEPRSPMQKIKQLVKERRQAGHHAASPPPATGKDGGDGLPAERASAFSSPAVPQDLASQLVFPFRRSGDRAPGHGHGSPTLHEASELVILPNALGLDPSLETQAYEAHTRMLCARFAKAMAAHYHNLAYDLLSANEALLTAGSAAGRGGFDGVLFPTLQFGRVGIFHDSFVVKGLLSLASRRDHVIMTSPYLNMYSDFLDVLIGKAKAESEAIKHRYPLAEGKAPPSKDDNDFGFDCITASVKTNGWSGHGGFAGFIPFFYLQLERAFYYLVKAYGCLHRVRIHEFTEEGLTFHAKGLYLTTSDPCAVTPQRAPTPSAAADIIRGNAANGHTNDNGSVSQRPAPYLVAYGSTNYGYRSVHKDVEAEGFFFTFNQAFREQTQLELSYLLRQSTTVEERQFIRHEMGRFQPVVSLVAQMGQDFL